MTEDDSSSQINAKARSTLLFLGALLLLVQFVARADDSLKRKSPVWDETIHMDYGALFLKYGPTFDAKDHPYPYSALLTLPMAGFNTPVLDSQGTIAVAHPDNLWSMRRMNLMVATIGLALLAWLVMQVSGPVVGLIFLLLGTLDPGWIAQARFGTTDIAHGLAFSLTSFLLFRFGHRPNWKQCLGMGAAIALALTAKFSGLLLLPLTFLVLLITSPIEEKKKKALSALKISSMITAFAFGLILIIFELHALLGKASLGAGVQHLWHGFQSFLDMRGLEHGSYFMGSYHPGGSSLYFPVLFLSKTPLLILVLLVGGLAFNSQRERIKEHRHLFVIPSVFLLISILSGINSGYRHMTPIMPFLWLMAAWALCDLARKARYSSVVFVFSGVLLLLEVTAVHPHYLPFTNQLWGGQNAARTIAVNAASDWGQDLTSLAGYVQNNPNAPPIHLAYFGRTDPAMLGIQNICRPCGALGFQCTRDRPSLGCDEREGTFAISTTCLEGAARKSGNEAGRDDCYAWLRNKEPDLVLGGSILIFKNPASAQ